MSVNPFQRDRAPSEDRTTAGRAPSTVHSGRTVEHDSSLPRIESLHEQEMILRTYEGDILTALGGPFALAVDQQHLLAVLPDGRLFLNSEVGLDEVVPAVESRTALAGFRLRSRHLVSGDFLRKLYDAHARRLGSDEISTEEQDQTAGRVLFHQLVNEAASRRASDLHVEVHPFGTLVFYRMDQRMQRQELHTFSQVKGNHLLNAAFNSCDECDGPVLQIETFPKGQISGQRFGLPHGVQSLRLQFLPLAGSGGALVLRFLYTESIGASSDLDRLGYARFQLALIHQARRRSSGLNLIAGVTGSGKSTTLEQTLTVILRDTQGQRSVVTIEDPPEYLISGAKQIPVTGSIEAREVGFGQAIRAVLRADPDIIMIGEVRDSASSNLALRAAKTGHQVWTTVHAISAVQALDRLIEEGVSEKRLYHPDVLSSLIAQRLVPRLCTECRVSWHELQNTTDAHLLYVLRSLRSIFEEYPHLLSRLRFRAPPGKSCPPHSKSACHQGSAGQTLVAEVCLPNLEFVNQCRHEGTIEAEQYWLTHMEGVKMIEHGLLKILQGAICPADLDHAVGLAQVRPERVSYLWSLGLSEGMFTEDDSTDAARFGGLPPDLASLDLAALQAAS